MRQNHARGARKIGLLTCVLMLVLVACGEESDGTVSIGGGGSGGGTGSADAGGAIDTSGSGATDAGSSRQSDVAGVDAGATTEADISVDAGSFGGVTKSTKPLEITGNWKVGDYSTVHLTSQTFGKVSVVHYDNNKNLAYTTAPVGVSGPGGISREGVYSVYQWVEPKDGATYLCQVDTGLTSEEQALQTTKTADPTSLDKGCNDGLWTKIETNELVGLWQSSFGGNEDIDPLGMGLADVLEWNNTDNTMYTQNPKGTGQYSERFNKIIWIEPTAGGVWYCKVVIGAESLEAAKKAKYTVDTSDPDNAGCNNFGWTRLIPLDVIGSYQTSAGDLRHVSSYWWGAQKIKGFDNDKQVVWVENPSDAATNPGKFSRVVWTGDTKGKGPLWTCVTDSGLSDLIAAQDASTAADSADPAKAGCNGKPWLKMDPI